MGKIFTFPKLSCKSLIRRNYDVQCTGSFWESKKILWWFMYKVQRKCVFFEEKMYSHALYSHCSMAYFEGFRWHTCCIWKKQQISSVYVRSCHWIPEEDTVYLEHSGKEAMYARFSNTTTYHHAVMNTVLSSSEMLICVNLILLVFIWIVVMYLWCTKDNTPQRRYRL